MGEAAVNKDTIIERETQAFNAKDSFSAADLIAHAAKKSGRGALSVGREMMKCARSKAKLKPAEYVMYEFYDREKYTAEEKAAFISGGMHGKIVYEFNDYGWFEAAGDKWLSAMFLAADGTPQPDTIAVIDQGPRAYHGAETLATPEAVRAFLTAQDMPLFCKYNNGRWSLGANIITAADDSHIHMRGKDPISYAAFFEEYIGSHVFLIQRIVENHSFLRQFTPTTATVRMVNLWREDGLWTPHAILKLPSAQNEADNFWRTGNLVCALDVETGEIRTCVGREGPDLVRHDVHPETGKEILGKHLPHWDKVRDLNARVAALHYPVKYQTQDIAITEEGPVEIEFNWGGAFELPQIATGKGFLTPEMRAAFRGFGSTKV
ncbi:sugar-transfer associated ATP-grasp domain-containing protein [Roseovarius aestuariivivens]|uniref:sugar-transfer associated ATP-grasp domain-containing protein n=1 Tax=Roseovarius aestuariivivens TaxID=1888910 RepID=UPI001436AD21|nr:sugar-transfer associated ATP-grasp domain-containing protein [Roseovarius aestuariivivens]